MIRLIKILFGLLGFVMFLPDIFVSKASAKDVIVKVGGDIQSAIDQVSAANVAGRVILEEGTYDLMETLVIKTMLPYQVWEATRLCFVFCR